MEPPPTRTTLEGSGGGDNRRRWPNNLGDTFNEKLGRRSVFGAVTSASANGLAPPSTADSSEADFNRAAARWQAATDKVWANGGRSVPSRARARERRRFFLPPRDAHQSVIRAKTMTKTGRKGSGGMR
jgi:hypothetical protein